jgi:hypothetical protein
MISTSLSLKSGIIDLLLLIFELIERETTMFCPMCKAEYRKEYTTCSDCNIPLVNTLPAEAEELPNSDETIIPPQSLSFLIECNDSAEALIIRDSLESNGIRTHVESKDIAPVTGLMNAALPQYNIFVPTGDMAEARKLLEMARSRPMETEFRNYVEDGRRKGMFGGRVICLILVVFFYWLFTIFPSDKTGIRYVPLLASGLFILLFFFSFKKGKDN